VEGSVLLDALYGTDGRLLDSAAGEPELRPMVVTMPISVHLAGADDDIRFASSPLVELGGAWHVFVRSDHHPERAPWVRELEATLPADLVTDLRDWSFVVSAVRAAPFVDPTMVLGDGFAEQLRRLGELPLEAFWTGMLRPFLRVRGRSANASDPHVRSRIAGLARARGTGTKRVADLVFEDPVAARERLVDILTRCWSAFFADMYDDHVVPLRREVRARSTRGSCRGWRHALTGLSPSIVMDTRENRLLIDKVQSKRLSAAGRGLVVVPTVTGSPHVYVADEPGRPIILHYPIPAPPCAADSRRTLRRLHALANPARLEIARAIAIEPRSAREIARLWQFAETSVTKHLAVLRAAGLVHQERVGHFVRYRLDDAAVASVGSDLIEVLCR
jgi:DNA-binding transcriptional ArsR family regulator